jgi:hypothetical protein
MTPAGNAARWSGPQFEALVLKAFRDALLEYCGRAVLDPRVDPQGLRIRITVVTASPQKGTLPQEVRAFAERTLRRDLPGTRLEAVTFPLDPAISEPGYRFDIQPPLPGYTTDPGSRLHAPMRPGPVRNTTPESWAAATEQSAGAVESAGTALILTFDVKLRFRFPLYTSQTWLPLGRDLPENLNSPALRIPNHVTVVPRGAIVEVRYRRDDVHLRRTHNRRDCVVFVDGLRLVPDDPILLEPAGEIIFVFGTALRSVLAYQLQRKE